MSNIKLDIPDITVVIEKGTEYLSTVTPSEIYQVLVNTGDNYSVVVDDPATIVTNGSGSYINVADYASTASYALVAQSLAAGGGVIYDTISASNAYFGNLIVSQSITANLFTGSFSGDGSQLTGIGVTGGTENYVPLWTGTNTLSSSLLFQTGSSLLLGATTQHTPEAPDKFGVFAGVTDSYNAVSVHGETDNYFQINIKNFSTGSAASADIVATTDSGTELFGYVNMGINGTGYVGGGDSIGGADDAYLYMAGDGDLLIGNTSVDRKIILFSGPGSAINNARVFIDTQGFVGINTSSPVSGAPEALAVQAIPESFNIISARASTNSYAQINIKNDSNGADASSDIVATADSGTEDANYINMGINSSQFAGLIGGPNDAYLYSTGSMLHIGNATPDNHIMFFVGGSDVEANNKLLLGADNLHQMTGSLSLSGSITTLVGVINNLTASFAMTASYVSGAASSWDTLSNKPDGLVSSSVQINTGSFSGSFTGTLIGTSSFATSASYAPTILPDGTVSSSLQINTGSFSGSFTGTLIGTSSQAITASYILPTGLPVGTISSSAQVSYPDLSNIPSGIVSSSTQASGWSVATASYVEYNNVVNKPTLVSSSTQINTGSFSGSFAGTLIGTSSWAISSSLATTSSYVEYANVVNKPTLVSSSQQINTGSFSGSFIGTLIGTGSQAVTASYVIPSGLPSGTVSSSVQINTGSFSGSFTGQFIGTSSNAISASYAPTILPSGTVSSSTQIDYTQIQNKPSVIATASYVEYNNIANKPIGLVSSSTQVNYTELQNIPSGIVSSSVQVKNLLPTGTVSSSVQINTGSFSGSFTGVLIGTASWASSAISSSYIEYTNIVNKPTLVSSSTQIDYNSIQNQPTTIPTASYVLNAVSSSFALTASYVSGAASDWDSIANKPNGLVSSSSQINTGSFSGSFIGTSSYATISATSSYISGGMVIIGLPTDGVYGGAAGNVSGIVSGDKAEDALDKIELILGKLAPAKPANLSTRTLTTNATTYSAYTASGVTPTLYSTITANTRPTASWTFTAATSGSGTTLSYDGDAGILQAEVDGVVAPLSQDVFTTASDVGTFGDLIVTSDLDPYNGTFGQQGFWKGFIASVAPTRSLALGPHNSRLLHSTTGNSSLFTWFLDNPSTPTITVATGSSTGGSTRYVSGVPTLATGEPVIITTTASNAISQFYNSTRIFAAVGNNSVAPSVNATLPVVPPTSASAVSASITLTVATNAYTTASTYTVTAYNSAGTTTTSTWTPPTSIRVDTISNETSRARSGIGWYPPINSTVSGAGAIWTASANLTGSRELQMTNNIYHYPSASNYSFNYPRQGPDYRTLVAETTSSFPGEAVRWATFSASVNAVSNINVVFNNTNAAFVGTQTTGSMRLYILVSGSSPTVGWIDGATAYPGVGNPTNNGDPALDVGNSTTTLKRVTFGSIVKTGVVFVRVGIPSSSLAGSTRTFGSVTIT